MRSHVIVALGFVAACSGTAHQIEIGPPPAKETKAVLVGGLCQDNHCKCRDGKDDGGVGVPEVAGRKRYEMRLTSAQQLWLTVNGNSILYKTPEHAEECFYIDLPTGNQTIELRASNPDGVSAGLQVHELGTKTKSWYDTFAFECGVPGVCSFEELDGMKAHYADAKHNVFDKCGTTKVKGITWDHGKAPDQLHPSELLVRLTLDVYKFAAWKPHGDPTCGEGGGRHGPSDEPQPPPDEAPAP